MDLQNYLLQHLTPSIIDDFEYDRWSSRLQQRKLTRDENTLSHCCVMVVIYNPDSKKVFAVDHKKAKMWLFPGGHIDIGELPIMALTREIKEELGLEVKPSDLAGPFSMQIVDIDNPPQLCREHYNTFYVLEQPPQKMSINMSEFHSCRWLSVPEAFEKIEDKYYKRSLSKFVSYMKW